MANVTITGVIKEIKDSQTFGNFEKREFWVIETEGQYPNTYALEAQQAFCNELDRHNIGELVECLVDVRGRHWSKGEKEGVMNTLKCYRITTKGAMPSTHYQRPAQQQHSTINANEITEPDDNLPF